MANIKIEIHRRNIEARLESLQDWDAYFEWMQVTGEKMQKVFGEKIKRIREQ